MVEKINSGLIITHFRGEEGKAKSLVCYIYVEEGGSWSTLCDTFLSFKLEVLQ